jgi:soluble lytic murein transglycosylase-like protein
MTKNRLGWALTATVVAATIAIPAVLRPDNGDHARVVVRTSAPVVARAVTNPARSCETSDSPANWYARRYGISPCLAHTIWREARASGVDPGIVFGLIAHESRFDPHAIGREGERGLMQIKPATARAYERDVTAEALMRPETNLRLGLLHLKREVEHFGHDWTLGLLAYHMGRGRLTRALERGRVPGTEYATRVLSHLRERPL